MACRSPFFQGSSLLPIPSPSFRHPPGAALSLRRRSTCVRAEMPPLDPLLSKLDGVSAASPVPKSAAADEHFPLVGSMHGPKMRAYPGSMQNYVSSGRRRISPPPDLPSLLLHGRIVFLGMPLVDVVTELIVSQLIYLAFEDQYKPIFMYINSTGTAREDGEVVALESTALAIYDAMMIAQDQMYTLCTGVACGYSCLFLAAGKKGKRFMLPNSIASLKAPSTPQTELKFADDLINGANEVIYNHETYCNLLATHTGNPVEVIKQRVRKQNTFLAKEAIEFGIIDRIYSGEPEKLESQKKSPWNL